jgi:hypothetical protein
VKQAARVGRAAGQHDRDALELLATGDLSRGVALGGVASELQRLVEAPALRLIATDLVERQKMGLADGQAGQLALAAASSPAACFSIRRIQVLCASSRARSGLTPIAKSDSHTLRSCDRMRSSHRSLSMEPGGACIALAVIVDRERSPARDISAKTTQAPLVLLRVRARRASRRNRGLRFPTRCAAILPVRLAQPEPPTVGEPARAGRERPAQAHPNAPGL